MNAVKQVPLGDAPQDFSAVLEQLPIQSIRPSPFKAQTIRRQHFSSAKMLELAASISANGVLQPILVRPMPISATVRYEIVAGERRWIAADRAGLAHIPATVRDMTDAQILEAQLIENIQREGLHVLEEAEGYAELMKVGNLTAEQIGEKIGKSRSYVYARLKLLDLIPAAREALNNGDLDASKALILARIKGEKMQTRALKLITEQGNWYSYRRLIEKLRDDFMIPIVQAPWLPDRDTLHAAKGGAPMQACDTCPNRSINDPELNTEVNGADVCTDRPCFDIKTKLHFARLRAEFESQGRQVVSGEAADAIFDSRQGYMGSPVKGGHIRLDAAVDDEFPEDEPVQAKGEPDEEFDKRMEAWNDRLDAWTPPTYASLIAMPDDAKLVQTKSGKLIPVAPIASVAKALKAKGIDIPAELKPKRGSSQDDDDPQETEADRQRAAAERARDEERRRIQNEFDLRLVKQIHAKYKGPLKLAELQAIAADMLESYQGDAFEEIYPEYINPQKLKEPALLQLIITTLVSREVDHSDKPPFTLALAQRLKIDVKKLRTEVVKDLKPVSAPAAEEETTTKAKKMAVKK